MELLLGVARAEQKSITDKPTCFGQSLEAGPALRQSNSPPQYAVYEVAEKVISGRREYFQEGATDETQGSLAQEVSEGNEEQEEEVSRTTVHSLEAGRRLVSRRNPSKGVAR